MPNSFRIKSDLGTDKVLQVKLEQNFDSLEILSMSINPEQEYLRNCAQFGVVCGRVFVNNGFGLPNARISIFIPLEQQDETNSIISVLYPYKDFITVNEDGYKYNLLPYTPSHSAHVPVGTFPERSDALIDKSVIEVYDKYYKYTVKTNDAGDFMIFGVPVGQHDLFMQIDLSDIGQFSLTPQDLIRLGLATEDQVDGTKFKFSENYSELPQIITVTKTIQVEPFYGEPEVCNYSITRTDYDLSTIANIKLQPTAIFMGSLISIDDKKKIGNFSGTSCKVKSKAGQLCDMTTGPGQIVAIRQTIFSDDNGRPILEEHRLDNDGKVIDIDGTWVLEVPMNLNYVYTDEYGQQRVSNNPDLGVPTKGKYRFKIKWLQSPQLSEEVKRAYYLLPNIKERGWSDSNTDPIDSESSVTTVTISDPPTQNAQGNPLSQTVYLELSPETVYRISFIENIQNLVITDPNGIQLNGTTLRTDGTYIFTFEVEDLNNPYTIEFDNVPINLFLLQSSYAFSLDWNEYANPTEAINCVDTFYEMVYNKVYTVSQLIDRYQSNRFAGNTLIIKKITDSNCEGTYNTFPTNDAIYRVDVLFVIISFFLDFFKFLTIPVMLILHVLAFLLTNIFYPFIIAFSIYLGILATSFYIDSGAAIASPVPQVALSITLIAKGAIITAFAILILVYADRIKEASKKLLNIGLPLVLYTDDGCERCNCQAEYGGIDQTEDDPQSVDSSALDGLAESIAAPVYDTQTSILIDVTSPNPYNGYTPEELQNVGQIWAGYSSYGQGAEDTLKRFPWSPAVNNGYYFTLNLPPAELYNLFNTKSKYYNNVPNFGDDNIKGYNQIKVNWIPTANNSNVKYHYDNVMILVLDKNKVSSLPSGQILSFQDSAQSGDINFGVTNGNINTPSQITVNYSNPDDFGQTTLSETYTIPTEYTSGNTTNVDNPFPADVEYFQVITGMTIGDFASIAPPDANEFSFGVRYLQRLNGIDVNYRRLRYYRLDVGSSDNPCSSCWYGYQGSAVRDAGYNFLYNENDIERSAITNYDDYGIVILMRGVDPNSPRIPQKIDLSRIFGVDDYQWSSDYVVRGDFKMNIPIQSTNNSMRPASHWISTNPNVLDRNIFFQSYSFDYSGFDNGGESLLPAYYSDIDDSGIFLSYSPQANPGGTVYSDGGISNVFTNPTAGDLYIDNSDICTGSIFVSTNNYVNAFTRYFSTPYKYSATHSLDCSDGFIAKCFNNMFPNTCLGVGGYGRNITGYYGGEIVAGASIMSMRLMNGGDEDGASDFYNRDTPYENGKYGSPAYISTSYINRIGANNFTFDPWPLTSNRQVFRSDRLPTSTNVQNNGKNYYFLHQNSTFAIFKISDAGAQQALINVTNTPTTNNESTQHFFGSNPVIESLSDCSKAVPLECYDVNDDGQPIIKPNCDQLMDPSGKEKYFLKGNGCYNLVSKPIKTIPKDIKSVVEWITRLKMNLAACFEIISHTFTNQYINGTLYTYPFRNVRVFDSNNEPFSLYCKDLVILHPSNNFYYRSSPFSTTSLTNINDGYFIGKTNPFGEAESPTGNKKYLGAPTTILDLGPRDSFLQELVYSDDYDGYIVAKLTSSSFQEITDILNIFILSRLINTSFLQQLIPISDDPNEGQSDPTIKALFSNTRWREDGVTLIPGFVDGDYSQMIAINSEFGIQEFSPESYDASSLYFSNADEFPYFGLFMKGNNQDRDYITPRRTIWNENAPIPPSQYDFTNIPVNSQEVPYYLWHFTGLNGADPDTIFGTQSNNYATTYPDSSGEFSSKFFSFKYQELDRINPSSRYVQVDGNNSFYYKGYIINYDLAGNPTEVKPTNNYSQTVLLNSPYHFYFGLKKGASALDKFFIKYVDTNIVIE